MSDPPLQLPPNAVLRHLVDVHCHPTDAEVISPESMQRLPITICAMSTTQSDQSLVRDLAAKWPQKVVPGFGYHPWFTHWISVHPVSSKEVHYRTLFLGPQTQSEEYDTILKELLPYLPNPVPLTEILLSLRCDLLAHPTALLGEVGLDRSFRVAFDYHAKPRRLSPFTIPIAHQLEILEAQLALAVELKRPVSMHSVKSQAVTMDLLDRMESKWGKRWRAINLDMHSCGLSAETWRNITKKHTNVFLSLSTVINGRSPSHLKSLIEACADDRILAESDFNDVNHCTGRTWAIVLMLADVKGWQVETDWDDEHYTTGDTLGAVRRLEANWKAFLDPHADEHEQGKLKS